MYRTILVVAYLGSAYTAPQDRIEPAVPDSIAEESKLENIPLSIPGNSEKTARFEDTTPQPIDDETDAPYTLDFFINDIKTTVSDSDGDKSTEKSDLEAKGTDRPNSEAGSTEKVDLEAKSTERVDIEVKSTEHPSISTEKFEYRSYKPTSKPRYYSKLSYFEKKDGNAVSTNLLEHRSNRRKFRSNCRCEKISNCPKLQISVPRCPEEQFMCCF